MNHEPQGLDRLNADFYSTPPHRYFSLRLALLLAVAASTGRYGPDLSAGLSCGPLILQQTSPGPVEFSPEEVEHYVATETVMLHHHLAECVVRLYLAHLDARGCPWIEVAMLRDHRKFRQLEEAIAEEAEIVSPELVAELFLGGVNPLEGPDVADGRWNQAAEVHRSLLVEFARHSLEGAALYNAAKHGLALTGTSGPMSLGLPGEEPMFTVDGPWISYLLRERREASASLWTKNTESVNAPRSWLYVQAGLYMLTGLWSVGEARYGGGDAVRPFIAAAELDPEALFSFGVQSGPQAMSVQIGTESDGRPS